MNFTIPERGKWKASLFAPVFSSIFSFIFCNICINAIFVLCPRFSLDTQANQNSKAYCTQYPVDFFWVKIRLFHVGLRTPSLEIKPNLLEIMFMIKKIPAQHKQRTENHQNWSHVRERAHYVTSRSGIGDEWISFLTVEERIRLKPARLQSLVAHLCHNTHWRLS